MFYQYCTVRGRLLVDGSNMLFCVFHIFIIKFVQVVVDILNSDHDCLQLQVWEQCSLENQSKDFVETELDKDWNKISESYIHLFLNVCPICFPATNPSTGSKMQPLKFILSLRVVHRAQIDLINME